MAATVWIAPIVMDLALFIVARGIKMPDWTKADLEQNQEINKLKHIVDWITAWIERYEAGLKTDYAHPLRELIKELRQLADK